MANIGDGVAFRAALGRIGFNVATQTAIVENGFATIEDLAITDEKSLNYLAKHLLAWRVPNARPDDQVRAPFLAMEKLKAMRYWVLAQGRIGGTTAATDFLNATAVETLRTMQMAKDLKEATEDTSIQKPVNLTDIHKWTKFWLLLRTYLGRVKGAAHISLLYLIRDHEEVTDEIRDADYESEEDMLIAITTLFGPHYEIDNKTLYAELKPLVVDGPGWRFIKKFDKLSDGRKAILALRAQAEGQSAQLTRKAKAYASMSSSAFRGQRRGFTFDNYVSIHQDAHNELFDLEEVVAESKKVTDFLKGIQDPHLTVGKQIVLGDPLKMGNFEMCQQYLGTLIQNTNAQSKTERNVSSASTGGGRSSGSGSIVDKIKGGSYSSAQWAEMSQPDRDRVRKMRDEGGNKKKGNFKSKNKRNRKVSKVKSGSNGTDDEEEHEETSKKSSGAGAQFGSNGNKKHKGPGE
jgi:hypothetical protein